MPVVVGQEVSNYMVSLLERHRDDVVADMEELALQQGFPIVGRAVGVTLEVMARAIGARRVFELGSGYGYSAFWFAKAVGPEGEVHCTDEDLGNRQLAEGYLTRAGLWGRIRFRISDAVSALNQTEGDFDIIYNDIDKDGYPAAWRAARDRIRVGGLYLCDNVLWSGHVATDPPSPRPDFEDTVYTDAIVEHNREIADDPDFLSVIVPTRDGVMVALRLR